MCTVLDCEHTLLVDLPLVLAPWFAKLDLHVQATGLLCKSCGRIILHDLLNSCCQSSAAMLMNTASASPADAPYFMSC